MNSNIHVYASVLLPFGIIGKLLEEIQKSDVKLFIAGYTSDEL